MSVHHNGFFAFFREQSGAYTCKNDRIYYICKLEKETTGGLDNKDYEMHTLGNGIRVVHKQITNSKIAHCGLVLNIGSRDEYEDQQGLAHFWEHMVFKGTKKRNSFHILNRLDSVGGELNAFTTKEKITFYASVLNHHIEKAVELLYDITFNSTFPDHQMERERKVILEEMALYHDNPEDDIQDEFDKLIFPGHPLGNNILGTEESVRSFRREDLQRFIEQNLDTEQIIFSSVSSLPFKKVLKLAEKYLERVPRSRAKSHRRGTKSYISRNKLMKKSILQAHCAIGRPAYAIGDPRRVPFSMMVNLLGGPAMNSRLSIALREKHGFVYSIDANYSSFSDTGLFSIFFATEKKQLYRSVDLVLKELRKLRQKPLGQLQLHRAKEQLVGQMAMAEENNMSLMLMMGRSLLDLNKIESFDEVVKQIRRVTSRDMMEVAQDLFNEKNLSFLYFIPKAN